jgi:prophage regulatory protein
MSLQENTPQPRRMIREAELVALIGIGATTLNDMVRAGTFPEPFRIGKRAKAWDAAEVAAWQDSRRGKPTDTAKNLPAPRRRAK